MQRQRGELVPIGEVVADLDGPVKAIREAVNRLFPQACVIQGSFPRAKGPPPRPRFFVLRGPPDSLRREASQAAGAAPTLRYGPAGDSAPRLRLKAAGMTERFPFGPSTRPEATRQPGPSTPFPS